MRLGQTLGGLLTATLGNAVELIVAILALIKVIQPKEGWSWADGYSVNSPLCNLRW